MANTLVTYSPSILGIEVACAIWRLNYEIGMMVEEFVTSKFRSGFSLFTYPYPSPSPWIVVKKYGILR